MYGFAKVPAVAGTPSVESPPGTEYIISVSDQPQMSYYEGSIAVKAVKPISGFNVMFYLNSAPITISSSEKYQSADVGALFFIITGKESNTYPIYLSCGIGGKRVRIWYKKMQMYQKTGTSGSLQAVDAWICNGGTSWSSINLSDGS